MKFLLRIFTFFILMTCLTNGQASDRIPSEERSYGTLKPVEQDPSTDPAAHQDLLLSSAQNSFLIIEEGGGVTTFARNQHNGVQHHSAKKAPFKHIKNGKTIDVHQHPFLNGEIAATSSLLSHDRYLFIIKKLRI